MENKELNLCEILKDRPKGTKLYTPLYNEQFIDAFSNLFYQAFKTME